MAVVVLSSTLAGCGGSGGTSTARTVTLGESQPGGGGDESPIATQVVYDVRGRSAIPPVISAPAFVRIALTFRSDDDRQHVIHVAFPHRLKMTVPPGGGATAMVSGQRKGSYAITVDGGRPTARIVVGQPASRR